MRIGLTILNVALLSVLYKYSYTYHVCTYESAQNASKLIIWTNKSNNNFMRSPLTPTFYASSELLGCAWRWGANLFGFAGRHNSSLRRWVKHNRQAMYVLQKPPQSEIFGNNPSKLESIRTKFCKDVGLDGTLPWTVLVLSVQRS